MLQPSKINFEAPLLDYMIIRHAATLWEPSSFLQTCAQWGQRLSVSASYCWLFRCGEVLVAAKPRSWTVAGAAASEWQGPWPLSSVCCWECPDFGGWRKWRLRRTLCNQRRCHAGCSRERKDAGTPHPLSGGKESAVICKQERRMGMSSHGVWIRHKEKNIYIVEKINQSIMGIIHLCFLLN